MKNKIRKIPIGEIAKSTFSLIVKERMRLFPAMLFSFLMMVCLDLAYSSYVDSYKSVAYVIWFLAYFAVLTVLAINCHRIFLLGSASIPMFGITSWSKREFVYFLVTVVLFGFWFGGSLVIRLLLDSFEGPSYLGMVPLLIYNFGGIYIISRISLVLPEIAIDKPKRFGWAWEASSGNGWRLLVLLFILPSVLNSIAGWFEGDSFLQILSSLF